MHDHPISPSRPARCGKCPGSPQAVAPSIAAAWPVQGSGSIADRRLGRWLVATLVLIAGALPGVEAARIGILLGTFDPPHLGIARMIHEARSRLDLATVYVVPTPTPVERPEVTPIRHRLAMLRLLSQTVAGMETLGEADLIAVATRRPDNVFEGLREDIVARRPPGDEFYQIVGEDAIPKLIRKRQLPKPGERRRLVVFPRQGVPRHQHPALSALESDDRLVRLHAEIPDLASTDLRALMRRGTLPAATQLPESIANYIRREGLYGIAPGVLGARTIDAFTPPGYRPQPVLLHGPTTDTVFVPAHVESLVVEGGAAAAASVVPPGSANTAGPSKATDARSGARPSADGASGEDPPDLPAPPPIHLGHESPALSIGSDVPEALSRLITRHPVQLVLFQSPTVDALDWLQTQGWRTLHGFIPVTSDDWPRLFFGRRGAGWTVFVTGIYERARYARLVADLYELLRRHEIPSDRLTALVPTTTPKPINPAAATAAAQ